MNDLNKMAHLDLHLPMCLLSVKYLKMASDMFLSKPLCYVLVGLNLSIPEIVGISISIMTSP